MTSSGAKAGPSAAARPSTVVGSTILSKSLGSTPADSGVHLTIAGTTNALGSASVLGTSPALAAAVVDEDIAATTRQGAHAAEAAEAAALVAAAEAEAARIAALLKEPFRGEISLSLGSSDDSEKPVAAVGDDAPKEAAATSDSKDDIEQAIATSDSKDDNKAVVAVATKDDDNKDAKGVGSGEAAATQHVSDGANTSTNVGLSANTSIGSDGSSGGGGGGGSDDSDGGGGHGGGGGGGDGDDEKQSDVITVYSPAGTPVQIIRSSFKNQYEGFGYTLVKPKLTPPSQSAIDNASANIKSNPSSLLEMQKKMDDHLGSVLAPTNKHADEKKAAEDVLKLKKYIHENVEDAAPAFDEAAFKDSIKAAGDRYRHERETPEEVWLFSKRFARKMCQEKDILNPGRMFTMADVPGDHDAAVLARYAHCLPNSSERRYGAIHMAVDLSIMTTNFGAATAPLLTMRFVPAEGDGHCGFRAAVIATDLKRCLREGRTPLNHDGYVSSAQFEHERGAMIALRRDEFNTINEILRAEQAPDKQFIVDALIGNALLPNAESDAVAMMREFREQCANHVKKEVSSIVFTVAAPLRGVSITVWAPYIKDTSLHRIGKHDEYASGLVVF